MAVILTKKIGGAGLAGPIGLPTDGTYEDGPVDITPDMSTADAIDAINEYLAPDPPNNLSGALTLTGLSFENGYLSSGTGQTFVNLTPGSLYTRVSDDPVFTLSTPTNPVNQFAGADSGYLSLYINDVLEDRVYLDANFNEAERDGVQSSTPWTTPTGLLSVDLVTWFNDISAYQRGEFSIDTTASALYQGETVIKVTHYNGITTRSTDEFTMFYDNAGTTPTVAGVPTIVQVALTSVKWLSGVRFYSIGDTFTGTVSANDIFDNTYLFYPMGLSLTGMNDYSVAWNDGNVTGPTSPPGIGDSFLFDGLLTLNKANEHSANARLGIVVRDPFGNNSSQTVSENRLVSTWGSPSDEQNEYFHDEDYRLTASGGYNTIPSGITGYWDSTNSLVNGQAQVFIGSLIYPTVDYTSGYLPTQTVDYSSFSGSQVYYRAFRDSGSPKNNGTLVLQGITFSDLGTNVKVEIKLPSQTGWLDLGAWYNPTIFTGADGDGCLVAHTGSTFDYTTGTFSTAYSGYMVIVRITFLNSSESITQINWS